MANCTTYGPLTKTWVVRWLTYSGKWEWLASRTTYDPLTKTWVNRWLTYFGKTEELGKLYYVRSTNETEVVRWEFFCFRDSIHFCCELWTQGGRARETSLMVTRSIQVNGLCGYVLTPSSIVVWPCYYGGGWKIIVIVYSTMVYYRSDDAYVRISSDKLGEL